MADSPLLVIDVNGQPHTEPSVSSRWTFDDSSQNRFVAQHDVILIGPFEGGAPLILAPYIDVQEIRDIYDPENLHILSTELASYLKVPSTDANVRGAYRLYIVRPGTPTQGSLILQSSAPANVATYTSTDYGTYVNGISLEIASGSIVGKRLTRRFRQEVLTLDNLQNAFHLAYTGNGNAATLTITRASDRATRLQTTLTGATDGSISLDLDLTQDTFSTISQLVTYLNGLNGYRCSVDRYADSLLPTYELDAVSAATIRTPIALTIQYVGAGSACTMTTTNTALNTTVTGGPGGENLAIDLTAASTDTLGELVANINGLAAYTCTLGTNADSEAVCNALLANVTAQDIRTTTYNLAAQAGKMDYVVSAALGSIIHGLNSVDARGSLVRWPAATAVPANLAQTFLTGGTNPTPDLEDWLDALEVVEQEDLAGGIVFPVTTDPVIQDAVMAWVLEQHTNNGDSFRVFFGTPDQTSAADAKTIALGMNSTFSSLFFQPIIAASGVTELPPLYAAAMGCGAAAGALPTQPITQMVLRGRGLPQRAKFSKAVREDLESNGVCVLREDKGVGVVLALALTTSLSQYRIDRILSESMARDVIEQRVRLYVKPILPKWAMFNLMPTIAGAVISALDSLEREGILSKGINAQNRLIPAYRPPTISLRGGLLRIIVHVLIGGEIDHIQINGTISYQQFELTVPVGA